MTRDEFQDIYNQGPEATFALLQNRQQAFDQALSVLTARVNELEARLAKDSHNSSKPPASDGLRKPAPKSLRPHSGKRSGGQPGHPGTTLFLADQPDVVVTHGCSACAKCGACLETAPVTGFERRQIYDLPPLRLQVTEHRALCQECPKCHAHNCAAFPAPVPEPVQYGSQIKALCVYLQHYQLLPCQRTCQLLSDVFGCSLSEGTLARFCAAAQDGLASVESVIAAAVIAAPVAHFDETGLRIGKKTHWLHVASTPRLTYYAPHARRGKTAMDALGVLPVFGGTAVHDAWPSYFGYGCRHALCNAHLLRELTFVQEQMHQPWAGKEIALLLEIKAAVQTAAQADQRCLSAPVVQDFEARYETLWRAGRAANPRVPLPGSRPRGRPKQTAAQNLLARLDRYRSAVLAFLYDFSVPFDNNLAERDLRMTKVRLKISGCFRTEEGARQFCRIRGYLSTLRKQGINVLTGLQSVFAGSPYLPMLTG